MSRGQGGRRVQPLRPSPTPQGALCPLCVEPQEVRVWDRKRQRDRVGTREESGSVAPGEGRPVS